MEAVQKTPEREAFYKKIDGENLSALWNVLGDLVTPEPRSACRPHLWKFDSIRDYMTEAGKLTAAEALLRECLRVQRELLGRQHPDTASTLNSLAVAIPARASMDGASS